MILDKPLQRQKCLLVIMKRAGEDLRERKLPNKRRAVSQLIDAAVKVAEAAFTAAPVRDLNRPTPPALLPAQRLRTDDLTWHELREQ